MTGNDNHMPLANVGSVITPYLSLLNVYLLSKLALNLAFVGQFCDSENYFFFVFRSNTRIVFSLFILSKGSFLTFFFSFQLFVLQVF